MPEQGATYTFEDLSGSTQTLSDDPNPYNALIDTCHNDPVCTVLVAERVHPKKHLIVKAKLLT